MMDERFERLRGGGPPRVLDLFAGCGGLSLGFQRAGFKIVGAVESDPRAAATHGRNFHAGAETHSEPRDILATPPYKLADDLGLGAVETAVDVIVGGPPCQAFARVGRAKLREVDDHPEAFLHDPRAQLYKAYLDYVDVFRPLALLVENVPDVLNYAGQNIAQEIVDVLKDKGYECRYTLLNSVFYGVPQMRERMFLVAFRRELGAEIGFPAATHAHELPSGYRGSRDVALRVLSGLIDRSHDFVEPPDWRDAEDGAITAHEAVGDLPPLYAREMIADGTLKRGARRFDTPMMPYDNARPASEYARRLKEWPGFEASQEGLFDHAIRYLPRDGHLFEAMREGSEYPELHRLAVELFQKKARSLGIVEGTEGWKKLQREMVPPYDPEKFPNKWWKLMRDGPARTLMAHLGKDSYSHIHYDGRQARTISVREAARLQSFPDGFRFCGTMNPAFRQIGNAVPPMLAGAIAERMLASIEAAVAGETEGTDERSAPEQLELIGAAAS